MNAVRSARSRSLRAFGAAVIGLAATISVGLTAAPASAACSPSDVGKSITSIKASDAEGVLSSTNTFGPWQDVNVEILGTLPTGGCAGDYLEVTLPSALGEDNATFPILTPEGQNMGQMTVAGRVVRMVFNKFIEDNDDVQYRGWLTVQVGGGVLPDTPYTWTFGVKGRDPQQAVRTKPCDSCGKPITWSTKWALVGADRKSVVFGIESAASATAGEQIVITDTVDDAQSLQCESVKVMEADTRDPWGIAIFDVAVPNPTITCGPKSMTVTFTARGAGLVYQVRGAATMTATRNAYTDNATVTQAGKTTPLTATATIRGGGADGAGKTKVTPSKPTPTTPKPTTQPNAPKPNDAAGKTEPKPNTDGPATTNSSSNSGPNTGAAPTTASGKGAGQPGKAKGKKAGKKAKGSKAPLKKGNPPKGKILPNAGLRII